MSLQHRTVKAASLVNRPVGKPNVKLKSDNQQMNTNTPSTQLVNLATLIRGKVYWYKNERFDAGESKEVSDELADILEAEHAVVTDADKQQFEKPYFYIQRKVPRPVVDTAAVAKKNPIRLPARLPSRTT